VVSVVRRAAGLGAAGWSQGDEPHSRGEEGEAEPGGRPRARTTPGPGAPVGVRFRLRYSPADRSTRGG
jgi:hypothetical protein